ncbi:hypothetical protein EU95_1331 [Prochlorococcus marinus str. MIT 9201]|uniref:Uncharacterized protein n=1 Tax=Prochlorococcus marinus str. MIT 9201 TaxID=93057 RepID=A0A0A2A5F2_PROMR|nr:hypothetical protein EU95_1331 [Prochlorococcus marinus str. MIT 9201]
MLNFVLVFMKKLAGDQKSSLEPRFVRKSINIGTKNLIIF